MRLFSRRSALATLGAIAMPVVAAAQNPPPEQLEVRTADGRTSRVTRWRPARRRGTILFSHGALSAPWKYDPLILPWVAAGFEVWAPLHVDSTDHPDTAHYPGLASWPARIEDMRALAAHVGVERYVAAGHSYGALVALTLGGASPTRPAGIAGPLADPRASAMLAFSPPGPGMGLIDAAGYATLAKSALIETGTKDLPFGSTDPLSWRSHLTAYEAAKAGGDRYALVLDGADHYFGGLICRPELPGPKQTAQLDRATACAALFLRAYAGNDHAARRTLLATAAATSPSEPGLYCR